jgi:hypothetical protein
MNEIVITGSTGVIGRRSPSSSATVASRIDAVRNREKLRRV